MTTLGFGQNVGQIVQIAYVVQDIHAAMHNWIRDCRVGPWFLIERFVGPGHRYRGKPATAVVSLAMSFAGHLNVELIQPVDDHPSVFKEVVEQRGFGFHHVGIAVEDVDVERAAYEARGYVVAFEAPVPSGGSVYYMDDGNHERGFIELIPATAGLDQMFTRFWQTAAEWDGSEPIRSFA
jgi:hypothetical protein